MSDQDEDKTAAEMFGEPEPGQAVTIEHFDPLANYQRRPGFHRRADGRLYPNVEPREPVETELPLDQCPDGSPRSPRRRERP
jgi:hypothetical protein